MQTNLVLKNYLMTFLIGLAFVFTAPTASFANDTELSDIENEISVNLEDEGFTTADYDRSSVSISEKARQKEARSRSGKGAHSRSSYYDEDDRAYVVKQREARNGPYTTNTVVLQKRDNAWYPTGLGISVFGGVSKPILANRFITTKPIVGIGLDIPLSYNMGLEMNSFFTRYKVQGLAYVFDTNTFYNYYDPFYLGGTYGRFIEIDSAREIDMGSMLRYEMFYDLPLTPYIGAGVGWHKTEFMGSLWYLSQNTPNDSFSQTTWTLDGAAGARLRLGRRLTLDGRAKFESAINNRNKYRSYVDGISKANDRERFQILGGITFEM
ncbi:MAG: hypothetical protein A3F16_07960 [Deltaproteobacteria bacterium RIFCSPHIGHO2_12_FULL_43_9]|nr:MAG: hypothetical protein A3F16_07960 [Deltaproteobacteria bacterium RIFCSPHIGHO2_12_FULL_43_9]